MFSELYSLIRLHTLRRFRASQSPAKEPTTKSATTPTPLRKQSVSNEKIFRPAIATMALGKPGLHSLDAKLRAAAAQGFQGVELYWDDLEAFAKSTAVNESDQVNNVDVLYAARQVRALCLEMGLGVISLQPFRDYDGLNDAALRAKRLREFQVWLLIARELGTSIIGVPPTINGTADSHSGDVSVLVDDLVELAVLAKPFGIQIAYENLCFGTHVQSWERAWEVVRQARKRGAEVGFIPDTFNICGDVFADPTSLNGRVPNATRELAASLKHMKATIPPSTIPFIQIADAERLHEPLAPEHPWMEGCHSAKMAWSRNARLFPMEEGGYLPMLEVIEAVVKTGWSGWVSQEVFTRLAAVEGDETVTKLAERAWKGWERLAEKMGWEAQPQTSSS